MVLVDLCITELTLPALRQAVRAAGPRPAGFFAYKVTIRHRQRQAVAGLTGFVPLAACPAVVARLQEFQRVFGVCEDMVFVVRRPMWQFWRKA